jgi:single-strand DNA-binding protein|tara:strand:+ start:9128 stop:9514 length:387 start_codon:yes stop_codon:yes gene_type:complete
MASYNKVTLVGNLTNDVELKEMDNQRSVANFGLAINESYKNANGERIDKPVFVDVTVWNRIAELCAEYIGKGSQVLIDGKLQLDQWQAEDGSNRQKLRVVGNNVVFLGSRKDSEDNQYNQDDGNDVPF